MFGTARAGDMVVWRNGDPVGSALEVVQHAVGPTALGVWRQLVDSSYPVSSAAR
ncbi:MAG: hypothetical protein H0X25_13020 [Acidobacteriales bacterium]|nr:hypothetical protein [Terriglobales bacterium]